MIYFTVGPSQLHAKYGAFMQEAINSDIGSISHRGGQFMELHKELGKNLKDLLGVSQNYHVFYNGCATEWMERIVQNCSFKETLHLVCGSFSQKFYNIARQIGRNTVRVDVLSDSSFTLDQLPTDISPELICLTHNETSTGVVLPQKLISGIRQRYPDSLIAMDVVSSAPVSNVDFSQIDLIFLSVQKGMGLPAGLGVILSSPRAAKISMDIESTGQYTGSHHSFKELMAYEAKHQVPETPNVVNMFLLNEVCKDYLRKGIGVLVEQTFKKAKILYEAVKNCSELSIGVQNTDFQSPTVIVAAAKNGSAGIIRRLQEQGFCIGAGYGEKKDREIRIGNFPAHTIKQVETLSGLIKENNVWTK